MSIFTLTWININSSQLVSLIKNIKSQTCMSAATLGYESQIAL